MVEINKPNLIIIITANNELYNFSKLNRFPDCEISYRNRILQVNINTAS